MRDGDGGLRDRFGDFIRRARIDLLQVAVLLQPGLGFQRQLYHGAHRFHRATADRGLAGQHHRGSAVENRVGDIADFGARRPRVALHRVEHLGGGDDRFAAGDGGADDALLDGRTLAHVHLDAEVAARHHDAVGGADDARDVVDAVAVFNLGDDRNVGAAVDFQAAQLFMNRGDVVGVAHE